MLFLTRAPAQSAPKLPRMDAGEIGTGEGVAPRVCLYLFLDASGATIPPHPSPRTASPLRYLECALVQAASLRLAGAACEILLLTNLAGPQGLGRSGRRMWAALGELGVERRAVPVRIEPGADPAVTRMPREAILAAAGEAGTDGGRVLWLPNLDSVWVDPARALAAAPSPGRVGALAIGYPPDWRVGGPEVPGASREEIGRTAAAMGAVAGETPPRWIGADLLVGTGAALEALVRACDALDERLRARGAVATNEQLLTLAAALGRIGVEDLHAVARRIQTGARHTAGAPQDPGELGIWHLPAEKGLSFRRAARALARGGGAGLRADLASVPRAMRRFNVGRTRRGHQLRDDAWVALGRLAPGRRRRAAGTLQPTGPRAEGRMH